jgi:hypothetical protein
MKISYLRSYRKKDTGRIVFVYTVSGTKAQLDAYKVAMADRHTVDESGTPLFFTIRFAGKNANLILTSENKAIVDMSEFDQLSSLIEQYPSLATALASQGVASLIGNAKATSQPVKAQPENGKIDE